MSITFKRAVRNDEHIHAKDCLCIECRPERDRSDGYASGHADGKAAGYAAAVADVVAFVRVAYPGYAQVSAKVLWPRSEFIIGLLLSDLEGGWHVGAAKKGAT